MNIIIQRIIATVMSFVMAASPLFSLGEKKETESTVGAETVRTFDNYLSIGDSIAKGFCVEKSYSDFIKEELTPSTFTRYEWAGLRSTDFLVALGGREFDANDPYYTAKYIGPDFEQYVYNAHVSRYVEQYVKDADLITLELGVDDVFYYAQVVADLDAILSNPTAEGIKAYLDTIAEGYNNFLRDFPLILDRISSLKAGQDYELVIVGTYNPAQSALLSEDFPIPITDAVLLITELINSNLKDWADEYGYKYADIVNVELGFVDKEHYMDKTYDDVTAGLFGHPTYPEGYKYIARQILNVLKAENTTSDTNIRIDLMNNTNIETVIMGSEIVAYTFKDHVLTIQNDDTDPKFITIFSEGNEDDYAVRVFFMTYKEGSGYSGYRLYASNNLFKTVTTIFTSLIKAVASLFKE